MERPSSLFPPPLLLFHSLLRLLSPLAKVEPGKKKKKEMRGKGG
jgi:hypothetical protein